MKILDWLIILFCLCAILYFVPVGIGKIERTHYELEKARKIERKEYKILKVWKFKNGFEVKEIKWKL